MTAVIFNEAVRYHELKGVVLPLISIDEFEPKTGKESEVIVVAFYCKEEGAAQDLRDFLEKGVVDTLDIDTSPSSDEHGRYLVFVELARDKKFWDEFDQIVDDTKRLSGPLNWEVNTYLHTRNFKIDDPDLKHYVILNPESYMTKDEFQDRIKGSVSDFFDNTEVDEVDVQEGIMYIRSGLHSISLICEGVDLPIHTEGFELKNIPSEVTRLQKILGKSLSVHYKSGKIYVENQNGNVLTLKLYD